MYFKSNVELILQTMKTETKARIKSVDSVLDELLDLCKTIEKADDKAGSYICLTSQEGSDTAGAFVMGDLQTLSSMITSFLVTRPDIFEVILDQLTQAAMHGLLRKGE